MRIAIHNHYAGQDVAETEFARRIVKAASSLGWEAAEARSSIEINHFKPDFVIALHFRTPKLTRFATYGSMVTPPSFFTGGNQFIRNILSYDGYLCSSEGIRRWLRDIIYSTHKNYFIAPWYTSCQLVPYRSPKIESPRLFYAGTNWDGPRFGKLFARLDLEPYLEVCGPQKAWTYIQHSYRGPLPFDGVSILDALNAAGVGLCLHRQEHCDAGAPSSRIFEIVASGAIAICQEHPFIRSVFQDSVLYLDSTEEAERITEQISHYMTWITQHPQDALNLSRRAYDIFAQSFTLEMLLANVACHHERLVRRKKFAPTSPSKALGQKSVQVIMRVGDRGTRYVERALESISGQTHSRVGAIVVQYKEVPQLSQTLERFKHRLPIQLVHSTYNGSRSTQLWEGLKAVSSEYFGILDDDDVIHPHHLSSLIELLDAFPDYGVAYSGAVRIWESDPASQDAAELPAEPAELMYFEPFNLGCLVALDNFITSNAFLARSSLIKDLGNDPHLPLLEDLFLLLLLSRKTNFVFSYEASCEFRWRGGKNDNSVLANRQKWDAARERIENLLWKEEFRSTQQPGHLSLSQLENKLTEMESILSETKAKADATATRLDRYLNSPFFNAIRRMRRKLLGLPPPQL